MRERSGLKDRLGEIVAEEGQEESKRPMGVGAKVKALTWERLMANQEVIHRWQEVCSRFT